MFKGAISEALGTADICKVLRPAEFAAAPSTAYLLDSEQPFFILQSKQDEYCFTGLSMVHLDGDSGLSKKRLVNRYSLSTCEFRNVRIETAGTVDLDCEIKFNLGGREFSIDVQKAEITNLICLYKALVEVSTIQAKGNTLFDLSKLALDRAVNSMQKMSGAGAGAGSGSGSSSHSHAQVLVETAEATYQWLANAHAQNNPSNFSPVFAKYIHFV